MIQYESIDREAAWVALFEVLNVALKNDFVTMGRKHKSPDLLGTEKQPACFLVQVGESKEPGPRGLPGKLTLTGLIVVYLVDNSPDEAEGDETELVATKLNRLIQKIDAAIAPDETDVQTLGGAVSHCWISGETEMDQGIFGKQAFASIPVHILVP